MHASIGAPRPQRRHRRSAQLRQRFFENALHRALRRLPLPAGEFGAVIMQHELHGALTRHARKLRRATMCRNQMDDRPTD
jgi:hypothetical protein